MAIEEPVHTVIEREEPFEVRDYQSYVVAETFVDGSFNAVGNEGFQRLFRYISGENRAAEKITMTAPVEKEAASATIAMTAPVEQQRAGARWRIAFVLPTSYNRRTRHGRQMTVWCSPRLRRAGWLSCATAARGARRGMAENSPSYGSSLASAG